MLPLSYKSAIELNKWSLEFPGIDMGLLRNYVRATLERQKDLSFSDNEDNKLVFYRKYLLLFNSYRIEVDFSEKNKLSYQIFISDIFVVSLLLLTLLLFFYRFTAWYNQLLIFGGVLLFYFIIVFGVNTRIQNILQNAVSKHLPTADKMSEIQEKWQKDTYKCSACGAALNDVEIYCRNCGIRAHPKNFRSPVDTTINDKQKFTYFYKKKKFSP